MNDCSARDSGRIASVRELALSAYSVEKLDSRLSGDDFWGLKPSPD
jgi:hypothetical protein